MLRNAYERRRSRQPFDNDGSGSRVWATRWQHAVTGRARWKTGLNGGALGTRAGCSGVTGMVSGGPHDRPWARCIIDCPQYASIQTIAPIQHPLHTIVDRATINRKLYSLLSRLYLLIFAQKLHNGRPVYKFPRQRAPSSSTWTWTTFNLDSS